MADIRAFVAHSYNEYDQQLVEKFVAHFESLAEALPWFSWDRAKKAEPISVSGKVLNKFEDKNVLIAICTRHEYALPPSAVLNTPFFKLVKLNRPDAQWKTSDWITQEIGLAVGRGMTIIVFLEQGVREPGGLFADIQYIRFSRNSLDSAFTSLVQMLSTLSPHVKTGAPPTEAKPLTSEKPTEPETNLTPQSDWDQKQFDDALFRAIAFRRDPNALHTIDTAFRASPFGKDAALTIWNAKIEFFRILANERFDFEIIKKAARDIPGNSDLLNFMAGG